jgi:hypothetical protein
MNLWIVAGIAAAAGVAYLLWVFGWFRRSRELDAHIDFSKVRKWKDEDDRG